ncbi:MAG TPA: SMP-30/gluconolactonase/LRE family protein [Pirellulales bacterium]|jgi:gluconolactonase|nr:SMP-30/gluconolactonase/LRE family protein [Pirellulales bacterium]
MIGLVGWTVVVAAGLALGAVAEPEENPIFPPGATLETLFERTADIEGGLTEGPAAGPDGGIYFSDIPAGPAQQTMIQRYYPRTGKTTLFTAKGSKANGLAFDARGRLLVCDGADGGGRLLARWNLESGDRMTLVERFMGKRFNSPNDLCVDRQGRIFFSDPRYVGSEPIELAQRSVYVYQPGAKLAELTHDVEMPNGVALSPDGRTLYVGDYHRAGAADASATGEPGPKVGAVVYAFPLSDGRIDGPRRTLAELGADNSCDGMAVDAAGNVYVTCRDPAKPGVLVVDPDGKRLAFFPTGPANQSQAAGPLVGIPSNVEFGVGQDSHSLYVTMDIGLFRVPTRATGAPRAWETPKQ